MSRDVLIVIVACVSVESEDNDKGDGLPAANSLSGSVSDVTL